MNTSPEVFQQDQVIECFFAWHLSQCETVKDYWTFAKKFRTNGEMFIHPSLVSDEASFVNEARLVGLYVSFEDEMFRVSLRPSANG